MRLARLPLVALFSTTFGLAALAQAPAPVRNDTMHLTVNTSISSAEIAPGQKLSLSFDITPKRNMHVYAPGTKYRAVTVTLNRNPSLKPSRLVYPMPSIFIFKPLQEQVLVYSGPFRLTMDIAVGKLPPKATSLQITGTLNYQACDDRVCYLPETVPLEWNLPVAR